MAERLASARRSHFGIHRRISTGLRGSKLVRVFRAAPTPGKECSPYAEAEKMTAKFDKQPPSKDPKWEKQPPPRDPGWEKQPPPKDPGWERKEKRGDAPNTNPGPPPPRK